MVPLPPPYTSVIPGSFPYATIKERLPKMLSNAIDCFDKTWPLYVKSKLSDKANDDKAPLAKEAKEIVEKLKKLHQELTTNQELTPFPENSAEFQLWNQQLIQVKQSNNGSLTWVEGPWLYVECYMYRRMRYVFEKSQHFSGFDPFEVQKREAMKNSMKTAEALAKNLKEGQANENGKTDIQTYLEMALWGNKCDLSSPVGIRFQKIKVMSRIPHQRYTID